MANEKYALLDTDFISKMHLIRKDDQNKLIDKIMAIHMRMNISRRSFFLFQKWIAFV